MICCLPFSYIKPERLTRLVQLFGKITVYHADDILLDDFLRAHCQDGVLDVRLPPNIDPQRLRDALREFNSWADRLQGRSGDLAALFKSLQGRTPMMDEDNPSQIGTRIRRFEQAEDMHEADALFRAALFMSMAHTFDAQQEGLARELGAVRRLEQSMFNELSGRPDDLDEFNDQFNIALKSPTEEDSGIFMTEQRLQAWADLAGADPNPPWLFVTYSLSVWESMLDKLPAAVCVARWPLASNMALSDGQLKTIAELAFGRLACDAPQALDSVLPRLELYAIADCSPYSFCSRLSGNGRQTSSAVENNLPNNTLIGLLTF